MKAIFLVSISKARPGIEGIHLIVACLTGLVLGLSSLWFSPLQVLIVLTGGVFVVIAIYRPELGLLAVLAISSTIFSEDSIPVLEIGPGQLYITDIILVLLFGLIFVRLLTEPSYKLLRTPLDVPLLLFISVGVISTMVSLVFSTVDLSRAIPELRILFYYLSFFIVTSLVRMPFQITTLLNGIIVLACGVAVAMLVQFFLGEEMQLVAGRIENLSTEGNRFASVYRIMPPGESLLMMAFILLAAFLTMSKRETSGFVWLFPWMLTGIAVLLTFNRNFWIGIGVAVLLLLLLANRAGRARFATWGLVAILIGGIVLLALHLRQPDRVTQFASATVDRFTSLIDQETYKRGPSSTLRWRDFEYRHAWPQIAAHPLIGMGLGAHYRPRLSGIDEYLFDGRGFIHNGHLWLMLKTGLLGYLCFAWLSFTFLWRGFANYRRLSRPKERVTVIGLTLIYLAVLLGSIVNPMLMQWYWTPLLGIMMGISEVVLAQDQSVERTSPTLAPNAPAASCVKLGVHD